MAQVEINGLCKRYVGNKEVAVKDFTLTVADGEFMVLLGPSGCGKSSVLRMVAGLEPITAGTISIDSRVVNDVPARDRDIAMVFQSYALYPHMNVFNNLAFGLRRRGIHRDDIEKRVRAVAEKLGLTAFLERKPYALSGGQRQRVALGRAIVRAPKVFLFDEPLSNLDAALRVTTRNELIRQQLEIGITTIYVTHDQVEAMTMGHRICIMNKGEVVQIGRPLDVYRNPANTFVARFLGNPPMNLLPGQLGAAGDPPRLHIGNIVLDISGWSNALNSSLRNGRFMLGIRPEDIYERTSRPQDANLLAIGTRVAAVEPLGAETLLVVETEHIPHEIIARIGRETQLRPGDQTSLLIDTRAIHLFDAETTRVIPRDHT
jgi:multiple sugar transport system ATP-binding protein